MKAAIRWICEHSYLLLSILAINCIQAAILTYRDLGEQVITASYEKLPRVEVTRLFIFNQLKNFGVTKILSEIAVKSIFLFFVQCIPVLTYAYFQSIKSKRIIALTIWLLPVMITLPKLEYIAGYLMSPLFSIGFFTDLFSDSNAMEDFSEGSIFTIAVMGWFNLFWLGVTIKAWFFTKQSI
jgi:hypothetical protein